MKVEYSRLLGSLTSSGMVRVSLRYGMIYDLKVKSYYDKLELILVPRPYNPEEHKMRSPQSMYFGRTYMRNLFPDFAISMRYQKGKLFIRSMQLQFIYDPKQEVYRCVLPRSLDTYRKYRTLQSLEKDRLQGQEVEQ